MGKGAVYECTECKHSFTGFEGDGSYYEGLRCFRCDHLGSIPRATPGYQLNIFGWKIAWGKVEASEIPDCPICKIPMRKGLKPMCPTCKSRKVVVQDVLYYND